MIRWKRGKKYIRLWERKYGYEKGNMIEQSK